MFDKIVSILVYPLGFSFLLACIALGLLVFRRARWAIFSLSAAIAWTILWSSPPVAGALARSLEGQFTELEMSQIPEADLILVFGGVMSPPQLGRPYPNLNAAADRVWHAARLYKSGKAPIVVPSAGRNDWQPHLPTQASTEALFLQDLGVPAQAVILEERSRNTYENALFCAALMKRLGAKRALLVTSALHMPRAAAALRKTGIEFTAVATDFEVGDGPTTVLDWLPNSQALQRSTFALHEWIGVAVYRWRGWI